MSKLFPYEAILKADEDDPEVMDAVLAHRIYPLFFQDKRIGQCRVGGLCKAVAHCRAVQVSI